MTDVVLPYGPGTERVRIPDGIEVRVVAPPESPAGNTEAARAIVAAALDAPVGLPPLAEVARGKRAVTVVVPDRTRPAGIASWLPAVLDRLDAAGVPREGVSVLVGGGIHAPATPEERRAIVGEDVAARVALHATSPDDPAAHGDLARDAAIGAVRVHRLAAACDLLVLCGAVAPHYLAGFSGGAKALVPGAADRGTVAAAHRVTLDATVAPDGSVRSCLGRTASNAFRDALVRIARRRGDVFLANVSLAGGRVVHATAGEVGLAHEAEAAWHRAAFASPRPEAADLVIAGGGFPRDRDLLQAHKALVVAAEAAKPGAPIVWLAHAEDGAGHPSFLPWFEAGRLERHLAALRREFHPYGLTAYALRWKAARHPVHVVSTLSRDVLRPMGLLAFDGAQAAVDHALSTSRVATCVVLPRASETFFA